MTDSAADQAARFQALSESDERYRAFIENTTEAIWRVELEPPVDTSLPAGEQIDLFYRNGFLGECNDAMAKMYGFSSKEEIVGARLGDLLVRDDPANVEYLRAFIESGYRLTGAQSREVDREGHEKFFVNNLIGIVRDGILLRAWGTQRDTTADRHLEQRRVELVARLEFLADVTAVLGSSLDYDQTLRSVAEAAVPRFADWCFVDIVDAHGDISRVAAAHRDPEMVKLVIEMERLYPTPPETPIGPPHTIRTGMTQSYELDDAIVAPYARSEEHLSMLRTLSFKAGLVVPLTARGRTLGALSFAMAESAHRFTAEDVSLAEDIGRRAGLAIDNARLYSELERANRAKDEFLAMLSHELRTPMTATLGWASMLQRGGLGGELTTLAAESILQSTRSQARLIDDLLDISRIVSGKMQLTMRPVVLADVITAAADTVRPAADAKQIELHADFREPGLSLYGDAERLQQVFWNLFSNAVKFTPRGGAVYVSLSRDHDGCARVTVRDTGEGIAPELLPHIFERFRQGDSGASRRFGGLGLGLSIARNLVELHGGTLTADSAGTGQGTEMTVVIPANAGAPEPMPPAEAAAPPAPLTGITVLLVEDDDPTRVMLEVALRHAGARVVTATSVPEALEATVAHAIDVLVSDIGLPGEDGCVLMRHLRDAGHPARGIAVTAYASQSERARALDAGFQVWLSKPLDPATLLEEVKRVAGQ